MGKTSKEKGKKSGSQRKKKSDGPDIPWKEALLAYEWVSVTRSSIIRPASRWGKKTWPDLRLKWPQVDGGRFEHIRLDSTW